MAEEATHPSSRWQLRVASSTDQLPRLRSKLRRVLRPLDLPRSTLHDIILSTHEAVVNGMVHGNQLDPAKGVTVTLAIGVEMVVVHVADEGPGFGWRAWLRHLRQEGQDPMALRGRGVLLMSRLMDCVWFNEAGNAVELVKRLRPRRNR